MVFCPKYEVNMETTRVERFPNYPVGGEVPRISGGSYMDGICMMIWDTEIKDEKLLILSADSCRIFMDTKEYV